MTSLASGEVDVVAGMLTVNLMNLIARGARIRLVGSFGYLAADGCTFNGFVAREQLLESGALADPDRLRELTWDADVLLPHGYWIDELLRPAGLTVDDLQLVNLPEATAVEAIRSGAVDVTVVSEPFLGALIRSPEAKLWRPTQEVVPDYPISVLMYGPRLLDERPELGERFLAAMLAARDRLDQGKTERNLEIVADGTGLSTEQLALACWPSSRSDGRFDPGAFDRYQSWALERGYVQRVLTEAELVDWRFIDGAVDAPGE